MASAPLRRGGALPGVKRQRMLTGLVRRMWLQTDVELMLRFFYVNEALPDRGGASAVSLSPR